MQPHNAAGGLSVLSVSINMQPLTGLGTSVGEFGVVKLNTLESAIKSHLDHTRAVFALQLVLELSLTSLHNGPADEE
jgi:hypothetical protein